MCINCFIYLTNKLFLCVYSVYDFVPKKFALKKLSSAPQNRQTSCGPQSREILCAMCSDPSGPFIKVALFVSEDFFVNLFKERMNSSFIVSSQIRNYYFIVPGKLLMYNKYEINLPFRVHLTHFTCIT